VILNSAANPKNNARTAAPANIIMFATIISKKSQKIFLSAAMILREALDAMMG